MSKYFPEFWNKHHVKLDNPITCIQEALHAYNNGEKQLFKLLAKRLDKLKLPDSCMVYAQALSLYIRTGNMNKCEKMFAGILKCTSTEKGFVWFEEYPEKKNKVLNGFLYTLLALHEYKKYNSDAKYWFKEGVRTLEKNLHRYNLNLGFFKWSKYDLKFLPYSGRRYHNTIHEPQLFELYRITKKSVFLKWYCYWSRYYTEYGWLAKKLDKLLRVRT